MPWTTKSAEKHIKGLAPKQQQVWMRVANAALKRCEEQGGADCDASAIKQANAVAKRAGEADLLLVAGAETLSEKGRVLSAENEKTLRAALAALEAVLGKIASDEVAAEESALHEVEQAADAAEHALEEVALSFNDKEQAIRAALKEKFKGWCWTRDVFDDAVVFTWEPRNGAPGVELGEKLYRTSYSFSADGEVTLGEKPEPVRVVTTYEPVKDGSPLGEADPLPAPAVTTTVEVAGDLVPLVEKSLRRDGTVSIKVIQPGWGSSGYYSAEVLKRDGPKVFKKGLHSYLDHPTVEEETQRPERSVRDLAGVLESDARWEDTNPAGPGLYADLKVLPSFGEHIEALAPHVGMSIRALGRTQQGEAEGRKGPLIEGLESAMSVDVVTAPGAGGQILQLFEAARGRPSNPTTTPGGNTVDDQEARALREANTAFEQQITTLQEQVKRQAEALLMRDIRDVAHGRLSEKDMPDLTRQRLAESLPNRAPVKEGVLDREAFQTLIDEAVKAELAYLAQATGMGSGRIRGMGPSAAEYDAEATKAGLEESMKVLLGSDSAAKIAANGR